MMLYEYTSHMNGIQTPFSLSDEKKCPQMTRNHVNQNGSDIFVYFEKYAS